MDGWKYEGTYDDKKFSFRQIDPPYSVNMWTCWGGGAGDVYPYCNPFLVNVSEILQHIENTGLLGGLSVYQGDVEMIEMRRYTQPARWLGARIPISTSGRSHISVVHGPRTNCERSELSSKTVYEGQFTNGAYSAKDRRTHDNLMVDCVGSFCIDPDRAYCDWDDVVELFYSKE